MDTQVEHVITWTITATEPRTSKFWRLIGNLFDYTPVKQRVYNVHVILPTQQGDEVDTSLQATVKELQRKALDNPSHAVSARTIRARRSFRANPIQ